MNSSRFLKEAFLVESSFSNALPSDQEERERLFMHDDPSEFTFVGNGGYAFWDNGAYIDICVHVSPGNWETVDNPEQYRQIPAEIKREYHAATGSEWPAPGGSMVRLAGTGQSDATDDDGSPN